MGLIGLMGLRLMGLIGLIGQIGLTDKPIPRLLIVHSSFLIFHSYLNFVTLQLGKKVKR